jgi:hypothetical protein
VIKIMLDQSLRVIDDSGLTTNAPAIGQPAYWRNIRRPVKNANCPCRSGKKVKPHDWSNLPPETIQQFDFHPQSLLDT